MTKVLCISLVIVAAAATAAFGGARLARSPILIALDRESGEEEWRFTNPEHGRWDVLGEQRGVVLLSYGSCDYTSRQAIIAVDRDTGQERWRLRGDPPDEYISAYASTGKAPLIVTTVNRTPDDPFGIKRLEGVDAGSAEVLWSRKPDPELVVVGKAREVIVLARSTDFGSGSPSLTSEAELQGIDRRTGKTRWTYKPMAPSMPGIPLVHVIEPANMLVTTFYGRVNVTASGPTGVQVGLDLSSGRELWSVDVDQELNADEGGLLFKGYTGPLAAYDPRTRDLLWTGPEGIAGVPRTTEEVVLAYTNSAPITLVAVDAHTGARLWQGPPAGVGQHLIASDDFMLEIGEDPETGLDSSASGVDPMTGETRWSTDLPDHISRSWFVGKYVYGAYGGCGA